MKIFVSYSIEDGDSQSASLVESIDSRYPNWEIFRYDPNFATSNNFRKTIDDEITSSNAMVWVVTDDSHSSEECLSEVERAKKSGLTIIAAVFQTDLLGNLRYGFNLFQQIDFSKDFVRGESELCSKLNLVSQNTGQEFTHRPNVLLTGDFNEELEDRTRRLLELLTSGEKNTDALKQKILLRHIGLEPQNYEIDLKGRPGFPSILSSLEPPPEHGVFKKLVDFLRDSSTIRTAVIFASIAALVASVPSYNYLRPSPNKPLSIHFNEIGRHISKLHDTVDVATLSTPTPAVTIKSSGLPDGLEITDRGIISGVIKRSGLFKVILEARSSARLLSRCDFEWEVGEYVLSLIHI